MTADDFWRWFADNHSRFEELGDGPAKEALLDELLDQLQSYCKGLWFETGGHPGGPRELVISAAGRHEYFPMVNALIARAPVLDGWQFIAFKPAAGFKFVTDYAGLQLDPRQMWFLPLTSRTQPESLGLRISGPSYDPGRAEDFVAGCHLVLECGLGELSAAEDVQHVEVAALPGDPAGEGWIELAELADYLEWRRNRGEA